MREKYSKTFAREARFLRLISERWIDGSFIKMYRLRVILFQKYNTILYLLYFLVTKRGWIFKIQNFHGYLLKKSSEKAAYNIRPKYIFLGTSPINSNRNYLERFFYYLFREQFVDSQFFSSFFRTSADRGKKIVHFYILLIINFFSPVQHNVFYGHIIDISIVNSLNAVI